jgi:hypothetical protein
MFLTPLSPHSLRIALSLIIRPDAISIFNTACTRNWHIFTNSKDLCRSHIKTLSMIKSSFHSSVWTIGRALKTLCTRCLPKCNNPIGLLTEHIYTSPPLTISWTNKRAYIHSFEIIIYCNQNHDLDKYVSYIPFHSILIAYHEYIDFTGFYVFVRRTEEKKQDVPFISLFLLACNGIKSSQSVWACLSNIFFWLYMGM